MSYPERRNDMKILTVSSANMDLVLRTERIPAAGETYLTNESYAYVPGGKGANSALAFARLGGDSAFCTALGNDANGDALMALYNESGINTEHIRRLGDTPTGLGAIILEKECAQNRIIVYSGANMKICEQQITDALDEKPDALFMQFEISPEMILFAAKEAFKRDIPVFFDAGPGNASFPYENLFGTSIFSPNETECEIITGINPDCDESCLEAAKKLHSMMTADYVVIKLGGRGCYVLKKGDEIGELFPSYPIEKVDTTAAGDAFTAAITLEYLKCGNIRRAARYANAVGALTVSRFGASTSIPTEEETMSFVKERGIRLDD